MNIYTHFDAKPYMIVELGKFISMIKHLFIRCMIKEITFEIHFNYFPFSQIEYGSVTKS